MFLHILLNSESHFQSLRHSTRDWVSGKSPAPSLVDFNRSAFFTVVFSFNNFNKHFLRNFHQTQQKQQQKGLQQTKPKKYNFGFHEKKSFASFLCGFFRSTRDKWCGMNCLFGGDFFSCGPLSINRTYARICGVKFSFHHKKPVRSFFSARVLSVGTFGGPQE